MYGLRSDIDLSFLTGREVEQIAIGTYQVSFSFDEDVMISAEGEFRYFDGEREWIWTQEPGGAQIAAHTLTLPGSSIASFEGRVDGTLELVFSNGCWMTILDPNPQYEAYAIRRRDQTIIV